MKTFKEIKALMETLGNIGIEAQWSVEDGEVKAALLMNDVFDHCADDEEIDTHSVKQLVFALADLGSVGGKTAAVYADILYAARRRKRRPFPFLYKNLPKRVRGLFEKCGPVREDEA